MEPKYIAQSNETMTAAESRAWFRSRAKEAADRGCKLVRESVHPRVPELRLLEGWEDPQAKQGTPNWQFAAAGRPSGRVIGFPGMIIRGPLKKASAALGDQP